ncbi:TadE/TadG family type IV pilus assembly protein [uncultured Cellulomonas sp.]|uniref:TadE/TadG family type IV pilus assembly protein n=1 Tax=uncultured Cellulomonas sp. TaxID=189682 RepID=UPI0026064451|nr:TadE/TadG family type IV pilus assembly protein [uncultured Cellulomonas sp.]
MSRSRETGSTTLGTVIAVPALLLVGMLLLMAGRVTIAGGTVQSAAHEAARAASISRTASAARTAANDVVATTLDNSELECVTTSVAVDTAAFARPVGQSGQVTVTVACTVPLDDLALPGVSATRTLTATSTSVLDTYRSRS